MIKEAFQKLADEYQTIYHLIKKRVIGIDNSASEIDIYKIKIPYQQHTIHIKYEFGNHNMAVIETTLIPKTIIPNIELTTRSHFSRLLSFKAKRWSIKSSNRLLERTILENLKATQLTELAEKDAFEPIIKGYQKNENYILNTQFYLGFNNKEKTLVPIITFYKNMIDYLDRNYGSY
ncbi:hypothetical protein [uncultured Winogradskyella sp.]|uniref:hypothetical protein n=1 Tax=uncultured Winogradskyella sp. TaxID=395353 RepID=UPI00261C7E58|nr:hypothetical protein [uncultured Winogradskyella sp.]